MKRLAILALALSLTGCASFVKVAGSPHTHAVCAAVDTTSTYLAVKAGATELNPVMAGIIKAGWGPFIAVQVGLVWLIYAIHDHMGEQIEPALVLVNTVKCGVAANNLGHL